MSNRAVAPVVGVALLVALTVILASAAAVVVGQAPRLPAATPTASFDAEADATGEIRVVHTGGDAVDPDRLGLAVRVDGVPLESQPPVPFFSARGFESGPTGVFNSATRGTWRAGEEASLRVAGSNEPALSAGATVELRIYVDDVAVAVLEVAVQAASTASPSPPPSASGSLSSLSTSLPAPSSPSLSGSLPEPSPAVSSSASASSPPPSSSSGTYATVVIARGVPGARC